MHGPRGTSTVPESSQPARPARRSITALAILALAFTLARSAPQISSVLWFSAAAGLLIAVVLSRGFLCRVALAAAWCTLCAGWFQARINERPADSLSRLISNDSLAEPTIVTIRGMILNAPEQLVPSSPSRYGAAQFPASVGFELEVRQVRTEDGWASAGGVLRARVDGRLEDIPPNIRPGATVECSGFVRPIQPPMNPGEPPRDLLAAQSGSVGVFSVGDPSALSAAPMPGTPRRARGELIRLVESFRSAVRRTVLPSGDSSRGRALVSAMLLGERDPALAEVESAFRRVGLVHLVAISGFNLAVLAWLALFAVRLTGDRGRIEPIIAALVVLAYLLVLPGESSIRRAGFGLLVFLAAEGSGRRYDRLGMLGWVAVFLLLLKPMDLWSLGFQLSFGVVAALIALAPIAHSRLWGAPIRGLVPTAAQRRMRSRAASWGAEQVRLAITASLVAWAVATPLIAHHTGMVSLIAPIASLIVMPLAAAILWAGYAGILLGLLAPGASESIGPLFEALGSAAVWIVGTIDEWPGACVYLPRLSGAWAAAATMVVVYWLWRGHVRDLATWAGTALVAAWLALAVTWGTQVPPGRARLDVLAMGDGSCVLVRSGPDVVLIGAGAPGTRPSAEDVRRAVRELGAGRVRAAIIPAESPDHWALLPDLIAPLGVRAVLVAEGVAHSAESDPAGLPARLLRDLREQGVALRSIAPGDAIAIGDVVVRIGGTRTSSLLIRVECGAASTLLAAPASHTGVQALTAELRRADCIVLPIRALAGERPEQTIAATGARAAVLASSPATARRFTATSAGDSTRFTALEGCLTIEVARDGGVRLVPATPR